MCLNRRAECRKGLESTLEDGDEFISVGEVTLRLVRGGVLAKELVDWIHLFVVVADPLFTALAWHLDQPGVGTSQVGQRQLLRAQWDAAHCTIDARALVFAVGLEAFAVLVNPAVVLTGSPLRLCSADASGCPEAGPEVALESLGVVAWLCLAAVFVELSGADLAAAAAV